MHQAITSKRRLIGVSVCVAATLLLAACTLRAPKESERSADPVRQTPLLEVFIAGSELPDPMNDDIKKALDAKLNIDLRIVACLGDECKTQLNMRMAVGNPPDIFYVDRRTLNRMAKQDQLLDLSPYIDLFKPTFDFVGGAKEHLTSVEGKQYGIALNNTASQYTYWVRGDWLDKLGLKPPTNLDELAAVAEAITFRDPDGNGKNDTYGFSGAPNQALGPIFGAFGTTYPGHFYRKDGRLMNSLYDPGMKPALEYIKALVDAGVVDPDFLSNTKVQHEVKAFQGQLGLFYYNWPNMINDNKVREWQQLNPNARWTQLPTPQGPGGAYASFYDPGDSNILVMPKTLGKSPYKLYKLIQLINYVSSPEGSRLVMYGIEGKHYTMSNGRIVPTAQMAQAKYSYMYQLTGRDELVYLQTKFAKQEPYFRFAMKQPRIEVLDSFIEPPPEYVPADTERYITGELYKFLYGKRPLSSYDDFLKTLDLEYHYDVYLQAAEQQLKSQGLL